MPTAGADHVAKLRRRRNSLPTELGAATQGDPRKVEDYLIRKTLERIDVMCR